MKVIAHRGNWENAAENSWAAFEAAVEVGADRIECDVQQTADGFGVIFHDATLERLTGTPGRVNHQTRAALSRLRLPGGEKIPAFEDVVAAFAPRIELNLEFKAVSREVLCRCIEFLRARPPGKRIILSSFCPKTTHFLSCVAKFPDVATLWSREGLWRRSPLAAALPVVRMGQHRTRIFHPDCRHLSAFTVATVRGAIAGAEIYPWVPLLDEHQSPPEPLWARMRHLGVDGLCTNRPRQLRCWLDDAASASPRR